MSHNGNRGFDLPPSKPLCLLKLPSYNEWEEFPIPPSSDVAQRITD